MNRVPKNGEFYRHFKNKLYQIITVAKHSETGEMLVIYQALYGDFKTYARPLEMFVSEVDHEKYPEVTQKYRFEKVEVTEGAQKTDTVVMSAESMISKDETNYNCTSNKNEQAEDSKFTVSAVKTHAERKAELAGKTAEEKLMAFFDTEDFEERYNLLVSMQGDITNLMINNIAVVLDVVIPEGDVEVRYEELKRCLRTKQRYENSRLR